MQEKTKPKKKNTQNTHATHTHTHTHIHAKLSNLSQEHLLTATEIDPKEALHTNASNFQGDGARESQGKKKENRKKKNTHTYTSYS